MEDSHYLVLQFLYGQKEPVLFDKFPQSIVSEFGERTYDKDGLYSQLEKVLKDHKNWIDGNEFRGYFITEDGIIAFQKEELIRNKKDYVSELQFQQLKDSVSDLQNKLSSFKPSNRRANATIIISILSVLAAVVLGVLKLKCK